MSMNFRSLLNPFKTIRPRPHLRPRLRFTGMEAEKTHPRLIALRVIASTSVAFEPRYFHLVPFEQIRSLVRPPESPRVDFGLWWEMSLRYFLVLTCDGSISGPAS
ncbi:hypothetical protein JTE90_011537 [Oedothorax gibbosus]|uniref:Uncharacterized protein n=1 Tax=Oedothorax gibbosus TaxID=931172 RepID=A0AAV6UIH8_9ARAC|nr:hypothetical protein JTE90_011537 [Oedothorax gibbosus]